MRALRIDRREVAKRLYKRVTGILVLTEVKGEKKRENNL